MSRPCVKCVQRLNRLSEYSGYRIQNVYYSTASSDNSNKTWITKIKLNHLVNQSYQHKSKFQTINGVARIGNRWRARPHVDGKHHNLGYFDNARGAAAAIRNFLSLRLTTKHNNHNNIHINNHVCSEHSLHECDHDHPDDHHHSCGEIKNGEKTDDDKDA